MTVLPSQQSRVDFETFAYKALSGSLLASLPGPLLAELVREAKLAALPQGTVVYRGGDEERCGLIVSGMMRQYLVHSSGREVTLRYAGPGVFAGSVIVATGPTASWAQAVIDTSVITFDVAQVRGLAQKHAALAWAMAQEIARTHRELLRVMADTAFGTIRQRTARHILDLALSQAGAHEQSSLPATLVARVTQQELADAVGSVREVVARILHDLRADRLVDSAPGRITVLDPIRLVHEAEFEAAPT